MGTVHRHASLSGVTRLLLATTLLSFVACAADVENPASDASVIKAVDAASIKALDAASDALTDGPALDAALMFDAATSYPSAECLHPEVQSSCTQGLCFVPSGCFALGVPRDELFAAAESDFEVAATLTHSLLVGQTEVTQEQWREVGLPDPQIDWTLTGSDDPKTPPPNYSHCAASKCPVLFVGFEDAAAYANLLSEKEGLAPCYLLSGCVRSPGKHMRCHSVRVDAASPYECDGYRLPTEAEWEYVASAGTRTAYYSGDMNPDKDVSTDCGFDKNLDDIGWYCGNSGAPKRQNGGTAHEVAQKIPNAWGLYDVSGNAWEWTNDIYEPFGYGEGPLTDPVGGVVDASDLTPKRHSVYGDYNDAEGFPGHRVMRGGAFDVWSFVAKSGRRAELNGTGGQANGFRIVRSVDTAMSEDLP